MVADWTLVGTVNYILNRHTAIINSIFSLSVDSVGKVSYWSDFYFAILFTLDFLIYCTKVSPLMILSGVLSWAIKKLGMFTVRWTVIPPCVCAYWQRLSVALGCRQSCRVVCLLLRCELSDVLARLPQSRSRSRSLTVWLGDALPPISSDIWGMRRVDGTQGGPGGVVLGLSPSYLVGIGFQNK